MSLGASVRDVGRTVVAGGRRLAAKAREYATSSTESDDSTQTGTASDTETARDASETAEAVESADDLARRIGAVVSEADPKYTAKVAIDGTKRGLRAGPHGAVAGAGAGLIYGVYASNREDFDPEEFSDPINNHLPVEELKSEYAKAAKGYRYGKWLGPYGGAVGTALGAGIDVMVRDGDETEDGGEDGYIRRQEYDISGLRRNGRQAIQEMASVVGGRQTTVSELKWLDTETDESFEFELSIVENNHVVQAEFLDGEPIEEFDALLSTSNVFDMRELPETVEPGDTLNLAMVANESLTYGINEIPEFDVEFQEYVVVSATDRECTYFEREIQL